MCSGTVSETCSATIDWRALSLVQVWIDFCEPFRTKTESIPLYVCFLLSSSSSMCRRTQMRSALADSSQSIWLELGCKSHLRQCIRPTISSTLMPHCLNVATSKASLTLRSCQKRGPFHPVEVPDLSDNLHTMSSMKLREAVVNHGRMKGKLSR